MTTTNYKFQGWMGMKCRMGWQEYKPKTLQETDVDILKLRTAACVVQVGFQIYLHNFTIGQ
jgi:hypothetical protein